MKTLVLSGINLFEGGPLSIYYDCLDNLLASDVDKKYQIIAFVHKKSLFVKYQSRVNFIEIPESRTSYIKRLYYEYCYFYNYSKKQHIDVWISLHDITPKVKADSLYTYCHNPSPFMRKDITKIKYSIKNVAFSFFYKYLYRINIKSATAIIVQQDWMRNAFMKMYPVKNVIVARPSVEIEYEYQHKRRVDSKKIFMFASYPRYFKNFEVICEASKKLKDENFEVWLTLDGTENAYSRDLIQKYGDIKEIKWMGLQSRNKVFDMYSTADCLIFPSTLETWGLPISEFKMTGKPIILSDLPYAHETLGTYDKAAFFDPYSGEELASIMKRVIRDDFQFEVVKEQMVEPPYASSWKELLTLLAITK